MKNIKNMALLLGAVLALLLASCKNATGGGGKSSDTAIAFDNTQGICKAIVYASYQRRTSDILAVVEAGSVSPSIAWISSSSSVFYFSYEFFIDGVAGTPITYTPRIERNQVNVRVDGGKTNNIKIPPLDETVDSPTQVLSKNVYMYVQNASSFPFTLYRNETRSIAPDGASSVLVNAGETALYVLSIDAEYVSASAYSAYSASVHKSFSGAIPSFEAGHIYRFVFKGSSGFTFGYDKIISTQAMSSYTVTYSANGGSGSVPGSHKVSGGSNITLAEQGSLNLSGKVFAGWNTVAGGTGTAYAAGASMSVGANTTLYAQWINPEDIRYTVSYDANGASGSTPAAQTINNGTVIAVSNPGGLSYSGKGFAGWNTNAYGTGTAYAAGASLRVSGDITLYAQWIAQHTVSYNANGASGTAPASQTANDGYSVTVAEQGGLSYAGRTFDGWNTSAGGTETAYAAGSSLTAIGDITLYAQWMAKVTYNANGGSGTLPASQTVNPGSVVTLAGQGSLTRSGYAFGGWNTNSTGTGTAYAASSSLTVNANVTLYAVWGMPNNLSLAASLTWIKNNAVDGGAYIITVKANEAIAPATLSYSGKSVSVTIKGDTSVRTISLNANGSLFTVASRVTLTLDNNITLQGRSDNTASLVRVNSGALVMNTGAKITGNTAPSSSGGVYVSGSGAMFTMTGGEISGNTASSSMGGGVYSSSGTFTMSGGKISGNTAKYGGGVYVGSSAMFTMTGGEISGNTASSSGGGVYSSSGTFTMSGGEISGNTAPSFGGGVHVSGTFTMSGGEISGNTASSSSGGGVYVSSGTFTMTGGEISGNTASSFGGGVYSSGTFTKTGGTIYGSNASATTLKNTAPSAGYGHAVYVHVSVSSGEKRTTTAGESVNLDSSKTGAAGGWE